MKKQVDIFGVPMSFNFCVDEKEENDAMVVGSDHPIHDTRRGS